MMVAGRIQRHVQARGGRVASRIVGLSVTWRSRPASLPAERRRGADRSGIDSGDAFTITMPVAKLDLEI